MWLTDMMEVLFGAALVSLALDLAGPRLERRGQLMAGVSGGAMGVSLLILLANWAGSSGGSVLRPLSSPMASTLVVDRFTLFVILTVLLIGMVVSLFAWRHFERPVSVGPLHALMLLLVASLVGVVSSGDLLMLFLFWEGMSVSAYGLVSIAAGSRLSLEASFKYFFMAGVGSLLVLFGISIAYLLTGTIDISALAILPSSDLGVFGLVMLVLGFGVEAAIVPLHTWLPDVYSASPPPVAALISGTVTGTGVFALVKITEQLIPPGVALGAPFQAPLGTSGLQLVLAALALATMTIGNLSALTQSNLRRMLAFSSVAQTGYMLAALSTLSVDGIVAATFTIWNHGLLKSNFFMLLGPKRSAYESSELESLSGLGREDRSAGFLYASSALGMVGSPPFGMFWGEILIVQALLAASSALFFFLAAAVVINIVLSIGYYYRVINKVVFGAASNRGVRSSLTDLLPSIILLGASLATGLLPFLLLNQLA